MTGNHLQPILSTFSSYILWRSLKHWISKFWTQKPYCPQGKYKVRFLQALATYFCQSTNTVVSCVCFCLTDTLFINIRCRSINFELTANSTKHSSWCQSEAYLTRVFFSIMHMAAFSHLYQTALQLDGWGPSKQHTQGQKAQKCRKCSTKYIEKKKEGYLVLILKDWMNPPSQSWHEKADPNHASWAIWISDALHRPSNGC